MLSVFLLHEVMGNPQGVGEAEEVPLCNGDLLTVESFSYNLRPEAVCQGRASSVPHRQVPCDMVSAMPLRALGAGGIITEAGEAWTVPHRRLLSRECCARPHSKAEGLGVQELVGREEIYEYLKLYAKVCVYVIFSQDSCLQ